MFSRNNLTIKCMIKEEKCVSFYITTSYKFRKISSRQPSHLHVRYNIFGPPNLRLGTVSSYFCVFYPLSTIDNNIVYSILLGDTRNRHSHLKTSVRYQTHHSARFSLHCVIRIASANINVLEPEQRRGGTIAEPEQRLRGSRRTRKPTLGCRAHST